METTEVTGKWRSVLSRLGIDVPDNPNKHGPCPICGKGHNSHRFRFDDNGGRGTWICTQCGAGDGWKLIQLALNVGFRDAVKLIEPIVGTATQYIRQDTKPDTEKIRAMMKEIWEHSNRVTNWCESGRYLMFRGIPHAVIDTAKDLIHCRRCYCSETKTYLPAMVGIVRNKEGRSVAMHRTYLNGPRKAQLESPRRMTPTLQKLPGCAIRLQQPMYGVLGIAEGIETALSANYLTSIPCWSTISANLLESFVLPDKLRRLVIFGDNDKSFTGQAAAYKLANRLAVKNPNLEIKVRIPDNGDWNDELTRKLRHGA